MIEEKTTLRATLQDISSSLYEIMITPEMYRYYQIFPKIVKSEFAVFYASKDMALELMSELEMILGMPIKFESITNDELNKLIEKDEKRNSFPQ